MTSRSSARAAAIAAACLGLALPTAAQASNGSGPSGGSSGGAGLGATPTAPTGTEAAAVSDGPVSADGNGFAVSTTAIGTYDKSLAFTGTVPSADSGDSLAIQRESTTGSWQTVATGTVASGGSFSVDWKPNTSGLVPFRAAIEPPPGTAGAASAAPEASSPSLSVTIYEDSIATIYGPGFYGHKTACGQTLKPSTVGVASRTLKCGTKVSIDYDGRSITVPVIDRGPFANNANWDLTEAAAKALGDPGTETVGAAAL